MIVERNNLQIILSSKTPLPPYPYLSSQIFVFLGYYKGHSLAALPYFKMKFSSLCVLFAGVSAVKFKHKKDRCEVDTLPHCADGLICSAAGQGETKICRTPGIAYNGEVCGELTSHFGDYCG